MTCRTSANRTVTEVVLHFFVERVKFLSLFDSAVLIRGIVEDALETNPDVTMLLLVADNGSFQAVMATSTRLRAVFRVEAHELSKFQVPFLVYLVKSLNFFQLAKVNRMDFTLPVFVLLGLRILTELLQ